MTKTGILLAFCALTLAACDSNENNELVKADAVSVTTPVSPGSFKNGDTVLREGKYVPLKPTSTIEILNAIQRADTTEKTYSLFNQQQKNWKLDKTTIEKILRNSRPINSAEWHDRYDILPIYMYGQLRIDGVVAGYLVNSGAASTVIFSDTTIKLGYEQKDYGKYFLSGPDEENQ